MKFYKGISPNTDTSENFIGTKKAFIDYLNAFKVYEVTSLQQNYVIYNEIKVLNKSPLREIAFEITYIYDELTNYFYHVRSCTILQDTISFSVARDTWANEIMFKTNQIKRLNVLKTNIDLKNGVYDDIPFTCEIPQYNRLYEFNDIESETITPIYPALVITAVYQIEDNSIGRKVYTPVLETFYITFSDLEVEKERVGANIPTIDFAVLMASSLGTYKQGNITEEFNVLKAYFVDAAALSSFGSDMIVNYWYEKQQSITLHKLAPAIEDLKFYVPTNPTCKTFVGTKTNNLELISADFNKLDPNIIIRTISKHDGIEVHIIQGTNQMDITNSFQINLTTHEGLLTSQERTDRTLQGISGILGIASTAINTGPDPISIAMGTAKGVNQGLNLINDLTKGKTNGSYVKGGDGYTTFLEYVEEPSQFIPPFTPYYYINYFPLNDNEIRINNIYHGFNFNTFINDLLTLVKMPLNKYSNNYNVHKYIQANAELLEGFTLDAQEVIQAKLKNGNYFTFLNESL